MSYYISQEDGLPVYSNGDYEITVSITMTTTIVVNEDPNDMDAIDDAVEAWAEDNGIPNDVDIDWAIEEITEV